MKKGKQKTEKIIKDIKKILNNMIDKIKNDDKKIIIMTVLGVISLIGMFLLGYNVGNISINNQESLTESQIDENNEKENEEKNKEENYDGPKNYLKYNIEENTWKLVYCSEEKEECNSPNLIPITSNEAKVLATDANKYYNKHAKHILFYDDGKIKLYKISTKQIIEENTLTGWTSSELELQLSYDEEDVIGIIVDSNWYYDIAKDDYTIDGDYREIYPLKGDYIIAKNVIGYDYGDIRGVYLVNLKTKKKVLDSIESGSSAVNYRIEIINNEILFLESTSEYSVPGKTSIYSENGKLLIAKKGDSEWSFTKDNNIIYYDKGTLKTIDTKGNLISSTKKYKNVLSIFDGNILYHDDKNVYIYDSNNTTTKIMEWEKSYLYDGDFKPLCNDDGWYEFFFVKMSSDEDDEDTYYPVLYHPDTKEVKFDWESQDNQS